MDIIEFTEDEAQVLECIGRLWRGLDEFVRVYSWLTRAAPPGFELFSSCMEKAWRAGIIECQGDEVRLREKWFNWFYAPASEDEDPAMSMDELFGHRLLRESWTVVNDGVPALNRQAYETAVVRYHIRFRTVATALVEAATKPKERQ